MIKHPGHQDTHIHAQYQERSGTLEVLNMHVDEAAREGGWSKALFSKLLNEVETVSGSKPTQIQGIPADSNKAALDKANEAGHPKPVTETPFAKAMKHFGYETELRHDVSKLANERGTPVTDPGMMVSRPTAGAVPGPEGVPGLEAAKAPPPVAGLSPGVLKGVSYLGRGLMAVGIISDAISLHNAQDKGRESARIFGGWVGAGLAGGAFATAGFTLGFFAGPAAPVVSPVLGIAGGLIGGIYGYWMGSQYGLDVYDVATGRPESKGPHQ
jgi:hypothetical protein